MITDKDKIVERAKWLAQRRVPFVHQGRSLAGIDCVGALAWIMEYDGELPPYPRDPVNGELERELEARFGPPIMEFSRVHRMQEQDILRMKPCDILSMQYAGPIRHVGLVVPNTLLKGQLNIVHTDSDVGHTTEVLFDEYWTRRIMKVWRLPGAAA